MNKISKNIKKILTSPKTKNIARTTLLSLAMFCILSITSFASIGNSKLVTGSGWATGRPRRERRPRAGWCRAPRRTGSCPDDGKVRWQAHVISPLGQEISARLAGRRIQTRPDAAESHPEKLYATKSAVMCGSDPFHGRFRIIPRWPSIEPILISAGRSYIN